MIGIIYLPRHPCIMNSVAKILLRYEACYAPSFPSLPQAVGEQETHALHGYILHLYNSLLLPEGRV